MYILNVRVIAALLANILWNQFKLIVRERVVFDRDLFDYEEYLLKGRHDGRLLRDYVFLKSSKGSKALVAEYFSF